MLYSIICLVIIPMLFVPIVTFQNNAQILESKINVCTQQTLSEISKNIENVIDSMLAVSNVLCFDEELIYSLSRDNYDSDYSWYIEKKKKIEDKITNAQNGSLYSYNSDIAIIGFDGNCYVSSAYPILKTYDEVINEKWYKQAIDMNGYTLWMAPSSEYFQLTGKEKGNIAMARLIKDNAGRGKGVLIVSIYPEMGLRSFLKSEESIKGSRMLLINSSNKAIFGSTPLSNMDFLNDVSFNDNMEKSRDAFTYKIEDRQMTINYLTIPKTNWKIIQMTPYESMMGEIMDMRRHNIIINSIIMGILIVISILISWSITRPLKNLSFLMQEVPKGNFSVRFDVKGKDEVADLGRSFNIMVKKINNLINQLEKAHRDREKARLEALQAQINPHFLLNTLNSIKWMAIMSGAENVSLMLSALGNLLETTLNRKEEMITLSEEITCVDNYILLQKIRYGDRFEMKVDVPERIQAYFVPCFILQPLVENSIIHGFEDIESGGIITIRGRQEGNLIMIEVEDNGKGIPKSRLKDLLENEKQCKGKFSNIGIKNVDERIRLNYGDEYGLTLSSREGKGTIATLKLPV